MKRNMTLYDKKGQKVTFRYKLLTSIIFALNLVEKGSTCTRDDEGSNKKEKFQNLSDFI